MKRAISLLLVLLLSLSLMACGASKPSAESDKSNIFNLDDATWEQILEEARGTTVTFYGWGGDENRNNWLNTTVASYVKENYDITLEVVGMNIDEILSRLVTTLENLYSMSSKAMLKTDVAIVFTEPSAGTPAVWDGWDCGTAPGVHPAPECCLRQ